MAIVERAANEEEIAPHSLRGPGRGMKTIEQLAAEHRALYPEPFRDLPLAVDIIRADRDSR
jgi:hypothetical protein